MNLADYQKRIDKNHQRFEKPYWDPMSQLARIIEEVGEVARILNHKYGDKPKKASEQHQELGDEIADIMYALLSLANSENIDLDEPMERAIDKLVTRDKDRFKKKSES